MLYDDYLKKMSARFISTFEEIDPHWNFDLGTEFEVAIASILEDLLPDKYGVCRGFVVAEDGSKAGDDIIIYDRLSSPVLRPPISYRFTRKEEIPIEAVYAYIEAKNTLEIGNTANSGTHILKAIDQVNSVRELVNTREKRELNQFIDGVNTDIKVQRSENVPQTYNPIWTMILSRGIRLNRKLVTNRQEIDKALANLDGWEGGPDLFVMDKDTVSTPLTIDNNYISTFILEQNPHFSSKVMEGFAFGFGLASLIYSLEFIKLKPVPWLKILNNGMHSAKNVIQTG